MSVFVLYFCSQIIQLSSVECFHVSAVKTQGYRTTDLSRDYQCKYFIALSISRDSDGDILGQNLL